MNILMFIFTGIYLVGIIMGYYLNAINNNAFYICMGLWAIMYILIQMWSNHNER